MSATPLIHTPTHNIPSTLIRACAYLSIHLQTGYGQRTHQRIARSRVYQGRQSDRVGEGARRIWRLRLRRAGRPARSWGSGAQGAWIGAGCYLSKGVKPMSAARTTRWYYLAAFPGAALSMIVGALFAMCVGVFCEDILGIVSASITIPRCLFQPSEIVGLIAGAFGAVRFAREMST